VKRGALWRLFYRASLADHSYRFLFRPGPEGEAVSLDCETTGLDPRSDDVLSVAAVRIKANRILLSERFEATVRPEDARASSEAIKVHRLRERDVAIVGCDATGGSVFEAGRAAWRRPEALGGYVEDRS